MRSIRHWKTDTAMLTEKDKKEMSEDAQRAKRREDFRRLSRNRYKNFTVEFEEMTKTMQITYPRHIIKTDRNQL